MSAAVPSCRVAWWLPRARRWRDQLRSRADGRALSGGSRVGAAVRGVQARSWRLPVRSSSPPTRVPGRERLTGCLDRRHDSGERGSELCRLEGGDEGPRDGLVDLDAADVEAIDATALDQDLAGAMIPRCGTAPAIVHVQAASAVPATGEALQQGAALPHGAAHFVRPGAGVPGDAILVGLIGLPIDEPRMMVRDEYLPFRARQLSHTLSAYTCRIQHRLLT